VDLSLFQLIEGLSYVPENDGQAGAIVSRPVRLARQVAQRPNIAAYLRSKRRIPFNESGIFRYIPSWKNNQLALVTG
jgi:glutathione S-transferase